MKARAAKKADCRRQKKPVARKAAPSENEGKTRVRGEKGRFVAGQAPPCGRKFGQGQPVDHGGRPKTSVREMAHEIAGEYVKLNDGSKVQVWRLVTKSVAKKAMGGDVRAAEVFAKWLGEDNASGDMVPGDIGVDFVDYRPRIMEGEE